MLKESYTHVQLLIATVSDQYHWPREPVRDTVICSPGDPAPVPPITVRHQSNPPRDLVGDISLMPAELDL